MKLITYADAANILGVSVQTLKQALEPDRNALTRAGRRGTNGLLIEEQVRLYLGNNQRTGRKKRLSLTALSQEEQAEWKRYARGVNPAQTPSVASVDEDTIRRIAQESYSQQFIAMLDAIRTLIESGVPQGDFFKRHPVLATITYALVIAASLATALTFYNGLSDNDKREVMAYLGVLEATLRAQESMPEPPISIEEIRQRRQRIAQFKQQIVA